MLLVVPAHEQQGVVPHDLLGVLRGGPIDAASVGEEVRPHADAHQQRGLAQRLLHHRDLVGDLGDGLEVEQLDPFKEDAASVSAITDAVAFGEDDLVSVLGVGPTLLGDEALLGHDGDALGQGDPVHAVASGAGQALRVRQIDHEARLIQVLLDPHLQHRRDPKRRAGAALALIAHRHHPVPARIVSPRERFGHFDVVGLGLPPGDVW